MKRNIYLIMLFLTLAGFRNSSTRNISGTVYDSNGKSPLAGVIVNVAGETATTTSDNKGHYSIAIAKEKGTLVFTFIGYERKEVKIGKSERLDVILQPQSTALEEVVVAGYAMKDIKRSTIRQRVSREQNTESYKSFAENQFSDPKQIPLSTFAVDVDAASYSNVRRYINGGTLPPTDAVRIEEMINYFHYNLAGPVNEDPVAIHTELSSAPWNPQHRLLRIGLKAKSVKTEKLPPSNLVFLIDVSGSMYGGNRLPLVQASMKLLVDQLRETDHVAIVTYAGAAGLVLPSTSGDQKIKIKEAIDQLGAGGSTAGGAGIKLAYQTARENFIKHGNNRIILSSDGDFNVGESSDGEMEKLIAEERKSGVSLSVLGFGMGNLKDSKMETLANKGHGNYAYIDNINEARKAMVTEFGGTLFTVAKDVKLQIEFNPSQVAAYRLLGYENRLMEKEDFNNDKKIGGDMGVGHTVTALYEIIPAGLKDSFTPSVDPLKYQKTTASNATNNSSEIVTIKFRYKDPESEKSKLKMVTVDHMPIALEKTSDDFRFASAVAELGLLLRKSEFKQNASFSKLISRAQAAKGKDEQGYRAEFIGLVQNAKLLTESSSNGGQNDKVK